MWIAKIFRNNIFFKYNFFSKEILCIVYANKRICVKHNYVKFGREREREGAKGSFKIQKKLSHAKVIVSEIVGVRGVKSKCAIERKKHFCDVIFSPPRHYWITSSEDN